MSDQHLNVVGWMWVAHLVEAEGCRGRDAVLGCRTKFGMASEHPSRQSRPFWASDFQFTIYKYLRRQHRGTKDRRTPRSWESTEGW